jgi:type VI secretion system Hcp family effector
MAHEAYVSITGQKQGAFKGESLRNTGNLKWSEVLGFSMAVTTPRDPSTGALTGRRAHGPVKIVKAWGAASPQLLTALCTNEVLTQVVIQFIKTNQNGDEYVFQTATLTNAAVSDVCRFTGDPDADHTPKSSQSEGEDTRELERVGFVYQKIAVEDVDGETTFSDDWSATV